LQKREPIVEVIDLSEFEAVWNRIVAHEGQSFHLIGGKTFTYEIRGNLLFVIRNFKRINVGLHRNSFAKAYPLRVAGPGELQNNLPTVYGCSYIWAILNNARIK